MMSDIDDFIIIPVTKQPFGYNDGYQRAQGTGGVVPERKTML